MLKHVVGMKPINIFLIGILAAKLFKELGLLAFVAHKDALDILLALIFSIGITSLDPVQHIGRKRVVMEYVLSNIKCAEKEILITWCRFFNVEHQLRVQIG